MSHLWINKYHPKKISDIIGNKSSINKLTDWINKFPESGSSVLVTGNHGVGKSMSVRLILDTFDYNTQVLYPRDIKRRCEVKDFINFKHEHKTILDQMTHVKSKKFNLIIDETESITLTSEKTIILNLFKTNTKKKLFPIIFICNNQHSKLINEIKKVCLEIRFYVPAPFEIKHIIKKISKKEEIKFNYKFYNLLINFCQKDIRRLIILLQEISYTFKNEKIKSSDLKKFFEFSRKKNIDISLFEATKYILSKYDTIDNILRLYETEKVLLPLMIHENYLTKVITENESFDTILKDLADTSDSISLGDNIETSIYTDQNWYLQNIHGFYTCVNTSYILNKRKYSNTNMNVIFSSDLNKTSLKNINRKNITNLLTIFPNKSIDEILIMNFFTNSLIFDKQHEQLFNIIEQYNYPTSLKSIELTTKIDKTRDFPTLTPSQKKTIQRALKERYINL